MAVEIERARARITTLPGIESAPCSLLLNAAQEALSQNRRFDLAVLTFGHYTERRVYSQAIRSRQGRGYFFSEEETMQALKTFLAALTGNRTAFEFFEECIKSEQPNWERQVFCAHIRKWEIPVGDKMLVGVKTVSFGEREQKRIWYVQGRR